MCPDFQNMRQSLESFYERKPIFPANLVNQFNRKGLRRTVCLYRKEEFDPGRQIRRKEVGSTVLTAGIFFNIVDSFDRWNILLDRFLKAFLTDIIFFLLISPKPRHKPYQFFSVSSSPMNANLSCPLK